MRNNDRIMLIGNKINAGIKLEKYFDMKFWILAFFLQATQLINIKNDAC